MAKLLHEPLMLVESVEQNTSIGKQMFIEGKYFSTNKRNINGRVYPKLMMESVIDNYRRDFMDINMAGGELNHPNRPTLDPHKIAIKINDLDWDNDYVTGKSLVVEEMPAGKNVGALMRAGFRMGVSSRGLGSLTEDNIVMDDYEVRAIDVVTNPSGDSCFVNALYESTDWIMKDGVWLQETAVQNLNKKTKSELFNESVMIKRLEKFLGELKLA